LESSEATVAQLQSLDKAAEVVALYENRTLDGEPLDMEWQDELPEPPRRRGSGAVEQRSSFNRFALKWAKEATGLKPTQLKTLKRAHVIAGNCSVGGAADGTISARALLPLQYFIREDRPEEIERVMEGGDGSSQRSTRTRLRQS